MAATAVPEPGDSEALGTVTRIVTMIGTSVFGLDGIVSVH